MNYDDIQRYYNHEAAYLIGHIKENDWNKLPSAVQDAWYNEALNARLTSITPVDFAKKFYSRIIKGV